MALPSELWANHRSAGARVVRAARKALAAVAGAKKDKPLPDRKRPSKIDLPPLKNEEDEDEDTEELEEIADGEDLDEDGEGEISDENPPFHKKKKTKSQAQRIADRAAAVEMRRTAARSLGISERKFVGAAVPPSSHAFAPVDVKAPRNRSSVSDASVIREIKRAAKAVRANFKAGMRKG
jgi:hypothetical protein